VVALGWVMLGVHAQNNATNSKGIPSETVEVVDDYKATIQDAQKISIEPNIPEIEEAHPKLDYNIPQRELRDFAFEGSPLRPLSMGTEKLENYNTSFIKIGLGSQLSPLAQLAYNDNKTKNLKFGLFYDHLSAAGFNVKNQRFSDDLLGVYAKYFPQTLEIGTNLSFHNYRTHFYGTGNSDTSYSEREVRQVLRNYDASVYLKNAQKNKYDINFGQSLNFDYLQETYGGAGEWSFAGKSYFDKTFLKYHSIYGNLDFDVSRLNNDSFTLSRALITPAVGYGFNNDDWKGHGQLGFTLDNGRPIFVTDLHIEKRLYEHNLIAYLGFSRFDQKNSLNSLVQTNNFIQDYVSIENSPTDDFVAGLKGTIFDFSYNLAFNLEHVKNFALFINDTNDIKRFLVTYDPSTWIYNFHLEAGYNAKEWLRILVFSDLNLYNLHTEAEPWQDPLFKVTLRGNYVWKDKLSFGADIYALTDSYAKLAGGQQRQLNGTADINLNAEYLFNKHLNFFVTLNNILDIKYQVWNNYQSYGINGMIGAKYSF